MALITNLQPPAGSNITSGTILEFDVIDPIIAELKVFVWVYYAATGVSELVYDGDSFEPLFTISSIANIPGGRRFSIQRTGGWATTPELRVDTCACPPTVAEVSSGFFQINAIDITALSGVQGAWNMEGNLLDRGPNGLDLVLSAGPALRFMTKHGKQWLFRNNGTRVQRPSNDSELTIYGALTIHQIFDQGPRVRQGSTSDQHLFSCGTGGSSSASNMLYSLNTDGNANESLRWRHERGNGSDEGGDFLIGPPIGPTLYTLRRTSDGLTYSLFLNGVLVATDAPAALIATDGDNSVFTLGKQSSSTQQLTGFIADTVVQDVSMSDADILTVAQQVGLAPPA